MKKLLYSLLKKPFFGRFNKPWRWPDDINQADWKRLSFKSESGAKISALVAESLTEDIKGAVLLCHPMGVSAKGFWLRYGHAQLLRQSGYHVMVFDFNGFGESGSTNMDFPLDVLAAGNALQNQYPNLALGLIGASLGGAMSVCAMTSPTHPFKAAVIESAFPTLMHFWRPYPLPKLALQFVQLIYPSGEKRVRPVHAANILVGRPDMLLIYGEADKFTTVAHGKLLFDALKRNTEAEFWQVEGATHTHAYAAQPKEYESRVVKFLDRSLTFD
ncbi:MAG: alpha/beta hydrolase family protein [Marinomonas sp.]